MAGARRGLGLGPLRQTVDPGSSELPGTSAATHSSTLARDGPAIPGELERTTVRSRACPLRARASVWLAGPWPARPSARVRSPPWYRVPRENPTPGNTRDKTLSADDKGYLGVKSLASEESAALQ